MTIRYSGQPATNLSPNPNTFPLTLDSALGSFIIERPAGSTADNVAIAKTGFEITITQSLPWAATTTLEGTFEGEVDSAGTTVKVTFDKASVKADGTKYALNLASGTQVLDLAYASSPATTAIPAKVTSPDPKRLLIKSYGFGPQGSEKRLEMMVNKANFEFESPAGCNDPRLLTTARLCHSIPEAAARNRIQVLTMPASNHSVRLLLSRRAMKMMRNWESRNLTLLSIRKSVCWEMTTRLRARSRRRHFST